MQTVANDAFPFNNEGSVQDSKWSLERVCADENRYFDKFQCDLSRLIEHDFKTGESFNAASQQAIAILLEADGPPS